MESIEEIMSALINNAELTRAERLRADRLGGIVGKLWAKLDLPEIPIGDYGKNNPFQPRNWVGTVRVLWRYRHLPWRRRTARDRIIHAALLVKFGCWGAAEELEFFPAINRG